MAYKTEELEKKAVAAIKEHELIFIEEVVSFLPCDKKTFYRHKCHECHAIKEALEGNKVGTKAKLRKKWKDSDSAPLNIALYKLCADDKELEKLTSQKTQNEHNVKGETRVILEIGKAEKKPYTSEKEIIEKFGLKDGNNEA